MAVSAEGAILFVYGGILIGVVTRYMKVKLHHGIPYTVIIFLTGLLIAGIGIAISGNPENLPDKIGMTGEAIYVVSSLEPALILQLFLPALIFDSAFSVNFHVLWKSMGQALLLAGPGVIINTFLTSLICKFIFPYDWNWDIALLTGAILSATDPVAVVALLKDLGASKRLSTLIEAESLINDGSAFVLFEILLLIAEGETVTPGSFVLDSLYLAGVGLCLGWATGIVTVWWLRSIFDDPMLETPITIVSAYLTFFLAEVIHVSSVLAVVVMGFVLARAKSEISPSTLPKMELVWGIIEYIANTLIFLLAGILVAYPIFGTESNIVGADFGYLAALYLGIHVTRFLTIAALHPFLIRCGYGISIKEEAVLWYGGLRGAVGLALALIFDEDKKVADEITRSRVLFHVSGIVFLTLIINGTTTKHFMRLIKADDDKDRYSDLLLRNALAHVEDTSGELISDLQQNDHFSGANWKTIQETRPDYIQVLELGELDPAVAIKFRDRDSNIRHRFLCSMKALYYQLHLDGMTSAEAVNLLVDAAEYGLDSQDLSVQWNRISNHFLVPYWLQLLFRIRCCSRLSSYVLARRLALGVELSTTFMIASARMGDIVDSFPEWKSLPGLRVVQEEHNTMKRKAKAAWINLRHSYPNIYKIIQTRHAMAYITRREIQEIDDLFRDGVIEERDHESLHHAATHASYVLNNARISIPLRSKMVRQLPFLTAASPKEVSVIEAKTAYRLAEDNDYLYKQGSKATAFFAILNGHAKIYKDGEAVATIGAGALCGTWATLSKSNHASSCQVSTKVEYLRFGWEAISYLLKNPEIERSMWQVCGANVARIFCKWDLPQGDITRCCLSSTYIHASNETIELESAALLLTGTATDEAGEVYTAPCIIDINLFAIDQNGEAGSKSPTAEEKTPSSRRVTLSPPFSPHATVSFRVSILKVGEDTRLLLFQQPLGRRASVSRQGSFDGLGFKRASFGMGGPGRQMSVGNIYLDLYKKRTYGSTKEHRRTTVWQPSVFEDSLLSSQRANRGSIPDIIRRTSIMEINLENATGLNRYNSSSRLRPPFVFSSGDPSHESVELDRLDEDHRLQPIASVDTPVLSSELSSNSKLVKFPDDENV
eukprot:481802_1